jgi:hypothetical protein
LSLSKRDLQLFFKRLRKQLCFPVRYYAAGEYGDKTFRPHYHVCLFGYDFPDRVLFKRTDVGDLYISQSLIDIWGKGHCLIGGLSFESAAYVARYCVKKIVGKDADAHYAGRQPEFALMSRRPGVGAGWLAKYGSDVYPSDQLIVRGFPSKPPRYFDDRMSLTSPEVVATVKFDRAAHVKFESDSRRAVRQEVLERRVADIRSLKESSYD